MTIGTARIFAPEHWGSLEKFSKFYNGTFSLKDSGKRAVSGAISHFRKAITLHNLAIKLVPNLETDEAELDKHGYTSAVNAQELSAIIESIFLELYSSVDCTRKVITEIYSNYQGIPNSTRKYFNRIYEGNFDERFPEQLIIAVREATWYEDFRKMRDELTHLETGSCHKNKDTGKIQYMHTGFTIEGRALVIDDIFEKINQTLNNVNQFIGRVFAYLLTQLKDEPFLQFCGIFHGRMYTRYVSPHEAIDFHSGVCEAHKWFNQEENPTCIFVNECGAYKNAIDSSLQTLSISKS